MHSVEAADGDSEGTPVALLEASASGLPVVATRHAGITDVVIDGETGSLVDEGDVDMMAAHMIELARNPGLAARMGVRGRLHVAARYSIDKNVGALWEVLDAAAQRA
jgi:glycosyltransferase involved in cell wall biosynthesis